MMLLNHPDRDPATVCDRACDRLAADRHYLLGLYRLWLRLAADRHQDQRGARVPLRPGTQLDVRLLVGTPAGPRGVGWCM
eukprot:scaffold90774_cov55-Phaeocystis_antarctica.AAC.2